MADPKASFRQSSADGLLRGENRLLVGGEVLQFAKAEPLGGGVWRLSGLLRGRGGTELAAQGGHVMGTSAIQLDSNLVPLDAELAAPAPPTSLAAIGLGDAEPVYAPLRNPGLSTRPLCPVHPRSLALNDGGRRYSWIRRSRGAWVWQDGVDVPLVEERESYLVGAGPVDAPVRVWEVSVPRLDLSASDYDSLVALAAGARVWVRQVGSFDRSPALTLDTLPVN